MPSDRPSRLLPVTAFIFGTAMFIHGEAPEHAEWFAGAFLLTMASHSLDTAEVLHSIYERLPKPKSEETK